MSGCERPTDPRVPVNTGGIAHTCGKGERRWGRMTQNLNGKKQLAGGKSLPNGTRQAIVQVLPSTPAGLAWSPSHRVVAGRTGTRTGTVSAPRRCNTDSVVRPKMQSRLFAA